MHPMLNTAIKAARRAAAVINRASFDLDRLKVTEKNHNDFVTDVDQAAEQAIIEVLLKAYPDHAILAEESGASANLNDDNENVWIIDPLDGTTNFIHGFPQYCVSIALQHRGQITQAVVYDPIRNDLFTATKGAGAYLNDKRIRVTKPRQARRCAGRHRLPVSNLEAHRRIPEDVQDHGREAAGLRRPGAAALDLAYVACGRLDGFFEKGLKPWDIAAGSLLITEAGGIVGNFAGESDYLYKGDIIAGSPKVFAQMVSQPVPVLPQIVLPLDSPARACPARLLYSAHAAHSPVCCRCRFRPPTSRSVCRQLALMRRQADPSNRALCHLLNSACPKQSYAPLPTRATPPRPRSRPRRFPPSSPAATCWPARRPAPARPPASRCPSCTACRPTGVQPASSVDALSAH